MEQTASAEGATGNEQRNPAGKDFTRSANSAESDLSSMFTVDERNAMRSFLQRAEVRLSTMHRIAVGFLSGAGLLFLLPVFLKDGVLLVVSALLEYTPNAGDVGIWLVVLAYLTLLYPFLLSLALPVMALILLLEDIVRFYFVGHPPSFPEELFNPRFALTGVAFSPDESPTVKEYVQRYEYGSDLITFVISRADARSGYYNDIIDKPKRLIVPRTRKLPRLLRQGTMTLADPKPLDQVQSEDVVRVMRPSAWRPDAENGGKGAVSVYTTLPYTEHTVEEIDQFNAALGLSGFVERPLYEEVAKSEVSLVRHSLKLRRLVLRYFQALLILIWTSFITFAMLPFLEDVERFPVLIVFGLAYFLWAALAPFIVELPLNWLVSHGISSVRRNGVGAFQKHDALHRFGKLTQRLCYVALASVIIGLALEIVFNI